jgi:hypothetical protein
MKKSIVFGLFIALLGTMSGSALAWGHHGGGVRFGVFIGGPLYYPYPPVYAPFYAPAYYPPVARPYSPPVYVEQTPAQPASADWYYCADAKAYYPYVRDCPAGWQRVPSQPR